MRISDWSSDVCSSDLQIEPQLLKQVLTDTTQALPVLQGAWWMKSCHGRQTAQSGLELDVVRRHEFGNITNLVYHAQRLGHIIGVMAQMMGKIGRASGREGV